MTDELIYRIGITLIDGIGSINAKKLIAYCGGAEGVFSETRKNLEKIPGMGRMLVENIVSQKVLGRAEKEIEYIEKHEIQPLYFLDPSYPQRLSHCDDSPVMLYYKGNANLNTTHIVGVVGTRHVTTYGTELCEKLISDLADEGLLIVSGVAYGVDSVAHAAAIKNNVPTVGCLGHGLHMIYPATNRELARHMVENGGLVTEFVSGTNPEQMHFPRRNRIIAGMSDCVVVIESAKKGGALITANIANSYNRDVFAFPGRTTDKYSQGCNHLIRTHQADIIESAQDLLYLMRWDEKQKKSIQTKIFRDFTDDERRVMDSFGDSDMVSIDHIIGQTDMNTSKLASILLDLEFDGVLTALPGKRYKKN